MFFMEMEHKMHKSHSKRKQRSPQAPQLPVAAFDSREWWRFSSGEGILMHEKEGTPMTLDEKIQMLRVDAGGLHDPWLRECGTFDASASFPQASVKKRARCKIT